MDHGNQHYLIKRQYTEHHIKILMVQSSESVISSLEAQGRGKWWAIVNAVINLWIP